MESIVYKGAYADLTGRIISSAIEVHRALGPGLLEGAYRACLVNHLRTSNLECRQEVPIPLDFNGTKVDVAYRADLIVDEKVLVELKAVQQITSLHEAQVLTYLKLTGLRVGLLINFNVYRLKTGVHRFVR